MKNHGVIKMIAFLLAACALTVTAAGGVGVVALAGQGLYSVDYATWENQFYATRAQQLAECVVESFAARSLSNLTAQQLRIIGWGNSQSALSGMFGMDPDSWGYKILTSTGAMRETEGLQKTEALKGYTYTLQARYPIAVSAQSNWSEKHDYYDDNDDFQELYLQYQKSPEYQVTVWITGGGVESFSGIDLELYEAMYHLRYYLIAFAAVGLLLSAVCLTYLCSAAGKSPKSTEHRPGGLNRLPLDVYGAILGSAMLFLCCCLDELLNELLIFDNSDAFVVLFTLAVAVSLAAALCLVAGVFALAAQWKMGRQYVWQHSLIGWCCSKIWKLLRLCGKGIGKLYSLLPLVWKYLLIAFCMVAVLICCFFLCIVTHGFSRGFWLLVLFCGVIADIAMVCYGAYAYGTVLKGARTMAEGNLSINIDTRYLRGSYKSCADDLNALADVAVEAAKQQMKSERMKAELVTNVSHDIKTPLTSVINYIDLLQKTDNPADTAQYLEVLDRQSQKLKKLIDDLMDMSKANTGNMPVEITHLDAVEAVNQALGEFADKLEQQSLSVVLRKPEHPVMVRADGRLLWRVLQNLMTNVVKYALPGTRVYAEVTKQANRVQISLKNISREELNISAEELAERFVRGDTSRNTEGSGLGLNIAKGFMQLQGGELELAIDGDLFKVTLCFEAG